MLQVFPATMKVNLARHRHVNPTHYYTIWEGVHSVMHPLLLRGLQFTPD